MIFNSLKTYQAEENLVSSNNVFTDEECAFVKHAYVKHGKFGLNLVLEYITRRWAYIDVEINSPYTAGEIVDIRYCTYNIYSKSNGSIVLRLDQKIDEKTRDTLLEIQKHKEK